MPDTNTQAKYLAETFELAYERSLKVFLNNFIELRKKVLRNIFLSNLVFLSLLALEADLSLFLWPRLRMVLRFGQTLDRGAIIQWVIVSVMVCGGIILNRHTLRKSRKTLEDVNVQIAKTEQGIEGGLYAYVAKMAAASVAEE